ncbi:MAG: serine/threonine protein kinase [Spirochaetales bacterium]|nr:serine/threonine protein kinase [Leptospiraceae bacterium]MCP5482465.1 serine/threonine protein kinase [Spirochaetales bacterium]MCP5485831.1 serine/threonine protein kinase [Spirochaetales bacterium]
MQPGEFFFQLTPERVLEAVESAGFEPSGHCTPLNSLENRVFDVRLEGGEHVVAKFYRPGRWSQRQIQEEHDFLGELVTAGIPVCAPVALLNGHTIDQVQEIHYAIWPRTGGRSVDEFTDEHFQILGRLLARIHNVGDTRTQSERPPLNGRTYGLDCLAYLEESAMLPAGLQTRYRAAVEEVARNFERLAEDVPVHRIHADCHIGNLLSGNDGWFFLDFDDFCVGPAVQDIWMLAPATDDRGRYERELLLEAYRQFRPFEDHWLQLIAPLRALRYIRYAAWIARRWEDPAFPEAFPQFGTEEYWEQETLDLEQELRRFGRAGADESTERAGQPQEELTNKDFFWDWEEDQSPKNG